MQGGPSEEREQELVKRAAADPDAFRALYRRYFRRVYGYVVSRTGNHQDAEDLVSKIFLHALRRLDELRNPHQNSFAAWLFAIARNAVIDHYRQNSRRQPAVPLDPEEAPQALYLEPEEPEQQVIQQEDAAIVQQLVASLPDRKREIVQLKYYGGLRNQEIAAVLQIGERTVSAYLSRALNELRKKYALMYNRGDRDYET